jgi:CDP-diacylglycerol--glycerol-3-phosphate 3-phosphatidyltransferase
VDVSPPGQGELVLNLPNALTIARICLVPVLVLLLLESDETIAAAAVFSAGMLTDAVDGHIARTRSLVTDFGKLMDPIADKLLVGAAFVCLALMDRIESWVVVVILAREGAVTGLRMLAKRDGVVIAASSLGKAKTAIQTVVVLALLLAADPYDAWAQLIVSATLAITIASGLAYLLPYLAHRRGPVDEALPAPAPPAG